MNTALSIPKRYPLNGTFELTVRCNLKCKMCLFRRDDSENPFILKNELTAEQWIKLGKEAAEMGTGGILITGGEPLLRKDFPEIYEGIYRQGFLITIYTNATLITPDIMELFKKYPPHKIGVSIYGATPETYKKVCGNADAFSRMLEGTKKLLTLPSVLQFRTTIIKDNFFDSREIDNLVRREFGEKYTVTQTRMVTKGVRGACADVESCRLTPEENVRLALQRSVDTLKNIIGESFDEKNIYVHQKNLENECQSKSSSRLSVLGCDGGMTSYTVTWDGKLQACQMLGAFQTDVTSLGLEKAWNEFPKAVKLPPVNQKCINCETNSQCQCCYGTRYAETGTLSDCPEYACEDSRIMYKYVVKE